MLPCMIPLILDASLYLSVHVGASSGVTQEEGQHDIFFVLVSVTVQLYCTVAVRVKRKRGLFKIPDSFGFLRVSDAHSERERTKQLTEFVLARVDAVGLP